MYDEAVLGPIDDFEELTEYLLDYENNWHMGNDNDDDWVNAVLKETPNLASVGYNKIEVSGHTFVLYFSDIKVSAFHYKMKLVLLIVT